MFGPLFPLKWRNFCAFKRKRSAYADLFNAFEIVPAVLVACTPLATPKNRAFLALLQQDSGRMVAVGQMHHHGVDATAKTTYIHRKS